MKRRIWITAGLLLAFLLPESRRTDISRLCPVEMLYIYMDGQKFVAAADTGSWGSGDTWQEAFADLENTTPGVIFLDTTEYLLITEEVEPWLAEMNQRLRPSIKVVVMNGEPQWENLSAWLRSRNAGTTLWKCEEGLATVPNVIVDEGRYYIV